MCPLRRRHILGVQHHTRPCEDALLGTVGGHHTPGGGGGGPCIREYTVFSLYSHRARNTVHNTLYSISKSCIPHVGTWKLMARAEPGTATPPEE